MDNSSNSSSLLWNESDLRLSTSLYQWAGFELGNDEDVGTQLELSEDLSTNKKDGDNSRLLVPLSPCSDGENAGDMCEIVREFLLEETSQFYNDVMNAQGEKCGKTGNNLESLRKRYETLCTQTANILKRFHTPGIDEEVNNRLRTIDAALSQLSPTKTTATATFSISSSDSGRSSTDELRATNAGPLQHWRHWIESMESDMCRLELWMDWNDIGRLEQRLKAQQALQMQVKDEGGYWVTVVQRYIDSWPSSHRRKIFSASVERRWHALWIKSLELQCRLERQIRALKLGIVDSDSEDAEMSEPMSKRRRLSYYDCTINEMFPSGTREPVDAVGLVHLDGACSEDICSAISDTIPFSETDYQSLSPDSAPDSHREEEVISARDGGYSSGTTTCDDEALLPPQSPSPVPPSPPQNSPTSLKRRRIKANRKSGSSDEAQQHSLLGASNVIPELLTDDENCPRPLLASSSNDQQTDLLIHPRPPRRLASFRRVLYRSWPIPLCLCVIVCLNLFYFYPSCCDRENRYWWSVGPKTYYSNGPPPT